MAPRAFAFVVLIILAIIWLVLPLRAGKGVFDNFPLETPKAEPPFVASLVNKALMDPGVEPQKAAFARPDGPSSEAGVMESTVSEGEKLEPLPVQPGLDLVLASPAENASSNEPTGKEQRLAEDDFAELVSTDSAQCQAEEENQRHDSPPVANASGEGHEADLQVSRMTTGGDQYTDQSYYALCMASHGW